MSPAVMEDGAKGPRKNERASQKKMDWRGSDWKCKREREKRRREIGIEMKRVGFLRENSGVFGLVSSGFVGIVRDWKRSLGLLSSSKNSILDSR